MIKENNTYTGDNYPYVSIIIIGQNESKNLKNSLLAVKNMDYPLEKIELLFVDSNSTDNSIEIAIPLVNKCISIRSDLPSAGEAFNIGIKESSYEYVWLSGGDIILDKYFLKKAIELMEENNNIHAVTGYWEENEKQGWNKILAYSFRKYTPKDHFVETSGGGIFRKQCLFKLDGFDERIKKGQETELGVRMKDYNYNIFYIHHQQGVHDYDINNIAKLIHRQFIEGISASRVFFLSYYGNNNNRFFYEMKKIYIKRILYNIGKLLILILFIINNNFIEGLMIIIFINIIRAIYGFIKIMLHGEDIKYGLLIILNILFDPIRFIGSLWFIPYWIRMHKKGVCLFGPKLGISGQKDYRIL
jgi:glycosyltransferase involved in cell wall biosynthesis